MFFFEDLPTALNTFTNRRKSTVKTSVGNCTINFKTVVL